MTKPTLRLVVGTEELLISIDSRSWRVLDQRELFPEGKQLRDAFGINWVAGLFRPPPQGLLHCLPVPEFRNACEIVWQALLRDQELLSYSYQYELGREKGVRHGGAQSGGFRVRGLIGAIDTRPKGYCTLELRATEPDSHGRYPVVEMIDLRKIRRIETDDAGYLKVHRRAMTIDWYREMRRILDFCDRHPSSNIEIRLYQQ